MKTLKIIALSIGLTGCATITTQKADLAKDPDGVRVYPPRVCLLADEVEKRSVLAYLPDYRRAYDVKPITILAKQDFKIELDEGQLKALTSNQDTTAFLGFLKEAANLAARAGGVGVSSTVLNGTFGLKSGIYCLSDDGRFEETPAQTGKG
jgi:hypothetical protein